MSNRMIVSGEYYATPNGRLIETSIVISSYPRSWVERHWWGIRTYIPKDQVSAYIRDTKKIRDGYAGGMTAASGIAALFCGPFAAGLVAGTVISVAVCNNLINDLEYWNAHNSNGIIVDMPWCIVGWNIYPR